MIRLLCLGLPGLVMAADLLVYVPEAASSLVVQRTLEADAALAGVTVRVSPRWRTFEEQLEAHPHAWILASSPALAGGGWHPVLQGQRLGSVHFRYRVIALNQGASAPVASATGTIGLVQECGRERLEAFLQAGFPGQTLPGRQRLVAKSADLLQVLGLEMVTCALVSPTLAAQAMSRFPGQVRVVGESRPIRLPVVAVRHPEEAPAAARLAGLAAPALMILGLDALIGFDGPVAPWIDAPVTPGAQNP